MAVSPSTSLTLEVRYPSRAGMLAQITAAIAEQGALIRHITITDTDGGMTTRQIDVEAPDVEHEKVIARAVAAVPDVTVLHVYDRTFQLHVGGKIEVRCKVDIDSRDRLSRAYTPGVARVCEAVKDNLDAAYRYTIKGNCVAIVSDGSAVLGLGNIGPYGALPVMEGKAMLFKQFAGVDAFPICTATQDPDELVRLCCHLAPVFGGINLEDIAAPRCFDIEARLREQLDIPVFHDDQHGTAVVVTAALRNALLVTGRELGEQRIVISGAGAAGVATAKLLLAQGVGDLIVCDSHGALWPGREGQNAAKEELASVTNRDRLRGSLTEVVRGADVFIGVSAPNVLSLEALRTMRAEPIVFALANPVPEVDPAGAHAFVAVLATGRSDFPNQVNNAVAFPGIFRGLLDARATGVNQTMLLAAAGAIAAAVPDTALSAEHIIPSLFQPGLAEQVARAVAEAARATGAVRQVHEVPGEIGY